MSIELQPGEVVDITIKGARIAAITDTHLYAESGNGETVRVSHSMSGVSVERVAPAEWPPQPGDVWREDIPEGPVTWFAQRYHPDFDNPKDCEGCNNEGWRVVMVPLDGGPYGSSETRPEDLVRRTRLVLVHREPQAQGPAKGDWTYREDDMPQAVDPSGKVWDLNRHVTDAEGYRWHWAGGFTTETPDDSRQPLMSRDDWSQKDVPIGQLPWPVAPCGSDCSCGEGQVRDA